MIALFDGGMMDAAWPVAQTPASSNPANPIAIADFGIGHCPPLAFGSVPPPPSNTMTLRAVPFKSLAP